MTYSQPEPPNRNTSLLPIVAALILAIATGGFVAYSMWTSRTIDSSAVSAGSSISPKAPNTIQDQPAPPPATTGSNAPPASPSSR